MLRSDLALRLAYLNPHLSEEQAAAVVAIIFKQISEALTVGNRVELRGLGTFAVKSREARTARNPKTGVVVTVADKRVVTFKPGKTMKARLINPEPRRSCA